MKACLCKWRTWYEHGASLRFFSHESDLCSEGKVMGPEPGFDGSAFSCPGLFWQAQLSLFGARVGSLRTTSSSVCPGSSSSSSSSSSRSASSTSTTPTDNPSATATHSTTDPSQIAWIMPKWRGSTLHFAQPQASRQGMRLCSYLPLGWGFEEGRGLGAAAATGRSLCRRCARLVDPAVSAAFRRARHDDV